MVESPDNIVLVITKQPSFEIFSELTRAGKILARLQDKSRMSSDEIMVDNNIKRVSHQLAKFQDKIVRVIAKQSLIKNLVLVRDKSRTSSGRNIGKITIKHASYQLAQYRDKVVRVTFLIMFDPLCILIFFILFSLLLFR